MFWKSAPLSAPLFWSCRGPCKCKGKPLSLIFWDFLHFGGNHWNWGIDQNFPHPFPHPFFAPSWSSRSGLHFMYLQLCPEMHSYCSTEPFPKNRSGQPQCKEFDHSLTWKHHFTSGFQMRQMHIWSVFTFESVQNMISRNLQFIY